MEPDAMILVFWRLSFKPSFIFPFHLHSLSPFIFIKRLFSSSRLSALEWYHLHIWGSWYFSWQSWFQLVIHPAQLFTWCTLHKGYRTKVTIYIFPKFETYLVLTVASWHTCSFLGRQVRWHGIPISFRVFHILLWSTIKGFNLIKEEEVDFFYGTLSFPMIKQMLAIWSLIPLPFLNPASHLEFLSPCTDEIYLEGFWL